jgi:hypothetical protein
MKSWALFLRATIWWSVGFATAADGSVVCPENASPAVSLAAREVQRCVYLRMGKRLTTCVKGADVCHWFVL